MLVRPAQTTDAKSMARIYVQSWRDTYLELVPIDYLYNMTVPYHENVFNNEIRDDRIFCFVAEDQGQVIGFCSGGFARNSDCIYSGEIYTLYVLKNWQRHGVGLKLVSRLAGRFNQSNIHTMLVWVLKHNPCRRFYEKINGVYLRSSRLPFAGTLLDVVSYGWIYTGLVHSRV